MYVHRSLSLTSICLISQVTPTTAPNPPLPISPPLILASVLAVKSESNESVSNCMRVNRALNCQSASSCRLRPTPWPSSIYPTHILLGCPAPVSVTLERWQQNLIIIIRQREKNLHMEGHDGIIRRMGLYFMRVCITALTL